MKQQITYLNFSEVMLAPPANFFSRKTRMVVKTEKAAPKPRTTAYPTDSGSGEDPLKKES